jgi:hypothetical protein
VQADPDVSEGARVRTRIGGMLRSGDVALWAALAVLAATAATITQRATRHGISTFGDSGAYLGMAENLRHGRGLTLPFDLPFDRFSPLEVFRFHGAVPSTHFPPGYPLALTVFSPPGVAVATGARVLGCVLAAATVILSARLTGRLLPSSRRWFQLATPALLIGVAGQPVGFLLLHAELGSEALFIVAVQASLLCAFRYLAAPSRWRLCTLTAATAASILTRHVGLFLPILLTPAIMLGGSFPRAARMRRAAAFTVGAVAPWSAFLVYGRLLAGGSGGSSLSELVYHPLGGTLRDLTNVLGSWIVASDASEAVHAGALLALVGLIVVALVLAIRLPRSATARTDTLLVAAAVPVYIGVVLYSQTFVDAGIPLNDRLLSPMRPIVAALFVVAFAAVTVRLRPSLSGLILALLVVVAVVPRWHDQLELIRIDARAQSPYHELDSIRSAPRSTLIVSSAADVVTIALQRPAVTTARPRIAVTDQPNRCFMRDLAENADMLNYYGGYAYFTVGVFQYFDTATPDELGRLVHLVPVSTSESGRLFHVAPVAGAPPPSPRRC